MIFFVANTTLLRSFPSLPTTVFSFIATTVIFKALAPDFVGLSVSAVALRRYLAAVIITAIVSGSYSTLVVGLANTYKTGDEAHYTGDGNTWAQVWAIHFLLMMSIIGVFLSFATLAGTPDVLGPVLVPLLLWSVLSIGSTDLAPKGYQFFWGAPMRYSTDLTKYVVFGTGNDVVVGRAVGVLFAWLAFWGTLFFTISFIKGQAGLDKTIPKINEAPGAKVEDNGKAASSSTEMVSVPPLGESSSKKL